MNINDIDELRIGVDFAIISNPTYLHYEAIELLANKNIPLFIEKPPLHSLEKAEELIALVEQKKLITYVACNLRFHPCIIFLKKSILNNDNRINEVNVYCGSYLPDWRPGKDFKTVYSAKSDMGGGVHLDLFHELDYTTWLFGMPDKSSSIMRSVSSLKIDAIDYANYTLEYKTFSAHILLNYYRRKAKRLVEVVFEEKTLIADLINNNILDEDGEVIFAAKNYSISDTYVAQLSYFMSLLTSNQYSNNSLTEGIDVLKIVLQK